MQFFIHCIQLFSTRAHLLKLNTVLSVLDHWSYLPYSLSRETKTSPISLPLSSGTGNGDLWDNFAGPLFKGKADSGNKIKTSLVSRRWSRLGQSWTPWSVTSPKRDLQTIAVQSCYCPGEWSYACVRYWPYRSVGTCAPVLKLVLRLAKNKFSPPSVPRHRSDNRTIKNA